MTTPRLEVDLGKVEHNVRTLVGRLAPHGISVTGVTKAALGSPLVAATMLRAGATRLGDSRVENVERMRAGGITAAVVLVRSPMLSQVDRVVACVDTSCNTEVEVVRVLSAAAVDQQRTHGVLLMVELGDLREGILPADLPEVVRAVRGLPGIELQGIGANLACQNGVVPDAENMGRLSELASSIEGTFGLQLPTVSGGSSANLEWALGGADTGRVDDLRLGESVLLGREPVRRTPIDGLHTDAFTLVAEVIEAKVKPSVPWGDRGESAFGDVPPIHDRGDGPRAILALGHQDTDPWGLEPPDGIQVLGASSDHLVVGSETTPVLGAELRFQPTYGALVRAMTASSVTKVFTPPD